MKIAWMFLNKKLRNRITMWPRKSTEYLKNMKTEIKKDTCTLMFIELFTILNI